MDEFLRRRNLEGDMAVQQSLEGSAVPVDETGKAQIEGLPIGRAEIASAYQTLQKYQQGKANLETRIVENDKWYRLRQWECLRKSQTDQVEPSSAWLLNAISNKHADAMDNFPAVNVLPREEGDKAEAKMLSSILPVVLDQAGFEEAYSQIMDEKIISGTGVYGVFWDKSKHNGLGDINITSVDLINLFWESGVMDIQQSRNLFYVTLMDNDLLEQEYPQLEHKLGNPVLNVNKYIYDDSVDTTDKSAVVDWYYKKSVGGKTVLHYCKFVAGVDEPLFASENEPDYAERGFYDHGKYPFVFDSLYRCKGTPAGFGFIDIGKSAQEYIDRIDQAVLKNVLFNARPRHFIREDGSVNEAEFADATKDFVHVSGQLGQDSILPIQSNPLNEIPITVQSNKVAELKEVTGNRDVSTGGTTSGVTAASAIAAMQEAGSKLSRDMNKSSYRRFREVMLMCIELIRQFYDAPRYFRILGDRGMEEFVAFSNEGLQPQPQGMIGPEGVPMEMGVEVGYRLPVFDVEVTAEKQSPYSKMAQNELALQFYQAGFFAPQNADAALACLDMMDFDRKEFIMQKVEQNGTLYQMVMQLQQQVMQMAQVADAATGSNFTGALAMQAQGMGGGAGNTQAGAAIAQNSEALGGSEVKEASNTRKARAEAAERSTPR